MKKITQEEAEKNVISKCIKIDCKLKYPLIYNNSSNRIYFICNKDNYGSNNEWSLTYNIFINQNSKCPKCSKCAKISNLEAEERIKQRCIEEDCKLKKPFKIKNINSKISLLCNKDNYGSNNEWNPTYDNLIYNKSGCPQCAGNIKITQQEAEERVKQRCIEEDCKLKESFVYKNSKTLISLICNKDNYGSNNEWNPTYDNLIYNKSGCPQCVESKGERYILKYLKNNNIKFIKQWKPNNFYEILKLKKK
jgi:hypothetical protein